MRTQEEGPLRVEVRHRLRCLPAWWMALFVLSATATAVFFAEAGALVRGLIEDGVDPVLALAVPATLAGVAAGLATRLVTAVTKVVNKLLTGSSSLAANSVFGIGRVFSAGAPARWIRAAAVRALAGWLAGLVLGC